MGSQVNGSAVDSPARRRAGKRLNGSGSIGKTPDGRLWVARYSVVEDGATKRRAVYAKTAAEADKKLREALARRDSGIRSATKETLGDFLDGWLATVRPKVSPSTFERYADRVRLHIVPALGKRPLARLEADAVDAAYAGMLAKLSPASVAGVHRTLHRALSDAVRWRKVPTNVAALADPPRAARHEMQTLTEEQAKAFIVSAAEDPRHEALFVLAVTTGMRQGELLGLRWKDVNLDAGWVRVTGTLTRVRRDASAGGPASELTIGVPKTAKSRRQVELTGIAVDALRRHRAAQVEQRVEVANLWQDNDLVFCGPLGQPSHKAKVDDAYHATLHRAGLPRLRFHDLRHTAATLMLGRGVHPKVASEMLGHATIAITLDLYSHATPTMQRAAVSALDGIFG